MKTEEKNYGFVQLSRSILYAKWYSDINTSRLFMHMLLTSAYENTTINGIALSKGQILTSYPSLAKKTGLTEKQVRTIIKKLVESGEILFNSTSKFSIISVIKYDTYLIGEGRQKGSQKGSQISLVSESNSTSYENKFSDGADKRADKRAVYNNINNNNKEIFNTSISTNNHTYISNNKNLGSSIITTAEFFETPPQEDNFFVENEQQKYLTKNFEMEYKDETGAEEKNIVLQPITQELNFEVEEEKLFIQPDITNATNVKEVAIVQQATTNITSYMNSTSTPNPNTQNNILLQQAQKELNRLLPLLTDQQQRYISNASSIIYSANSNILYGDYALAINNYIASTDFYTFSEQVNNIMHNAGIALIVGDIQKKYKTTQRNAYFIYQLQVEVQKYNIDINAPRVLRTIERIVTMGVKYKKEFLQKDIQEIILDPLCAQKL